MSLRPCADSSRNGMDKQMEYWVLIERGTQAEYGLLSHCAGWCGAKEIAVALLRQGLAPETAHRCGARKIYLLEGDADPRQAAEQIVGIARELEPVAILCTADGFGRMTAAALAALLRTGLAADCTRIDKRSDGLLLMTRPTFGGNLMADIICPDTRPQMATVRPGIYLPEPCGEGIRETEEIRVAEAGIARDTCLLERIASDVRSLSSARVILAGGRGVGSMEGFSLLEKLALRLGAAVGASRAAVNAGYATYRQQIGLTGQTVRPDIYFAFGISGAVQHLVGMEYADLIIAVNSDPKAPIFEYANYGIVGDWRDNAEGLLKALDSVSPVA